MTQDNSAIVRRFVDEGHQSGENRLGRRVRLEGRGRAGSPPRPGPRARRNEGCSARYAIRVPRYRILHQGAGLRGRQGRERFEWTGTHKAEFMGVPATNCPRISAKASALTGSRSALKSSRSTAIGLRSTMSMTLVILVYPGAAGHRTAHSTYREGAARGPYPNSVLYPPPGPRVPRLPAG